MAGTFFADAAVYTFWVVANLSVNTLYRDICFEDNLIDLCVFTGYNTIPCDIADKELLKFELM